MNGRTLPAVEERGRLEINPVVLRKIVEHAADQVPGTLRHERRLAGIDVGEAGASAKITTGSGDPSAVDVRLELHLQYPAAVRTVVSAVRERVSHELDRLAGHHVRACTVVVSGLRGAHHLGPRPR
ncbi:Asp23/Gls24 family envelope stress response protein [Pseudonocardia alaniniphila]|uniref:Asp23/Gls24 family envelope stress response protein n=1 Tax=Pseudonocardia alaniniphila TaxID=75291 RepID=A0ABS9TJ74_9PSEU|nr:Asp23/Gls24 family envelope stress response protein [Pseudonocardia alaniniphila]MCH6168570.1 Asp23/Gls24 family envelope stress response protein [Pseudonocardia alaniniphila]